MQFTLKRANNYNWELKMNFENIWSRHTLLFYRWEIKVHVRDKHKNKSYLLNLAKSTYTCIINSEEKQFGFSI
jgi:hypothetical protein